jgi:hypothetical protein
MTSSLSLLREPRKRPAGLPEKSPLRGGKMRLASRLAPPPHAAHPPRRLPALRSRCAPCSRSSFTDCAKKRVRYLTEREMEQLIDCARKWPLRASRCNHDPGRLPSRPARWQQIELSEGRLHVHRVKNGISSVHPIRGDEMRALRE